MATLLLNMLIPGTIKVTLVLSAAWLLSRAMTRCSAAVRHLMWTAALMSTLMIPLVQVAAPRWSVPVLAAGSTPAVVTNMQQPVEAAVIDAGTVLPAGDVAPLVAPQRTIAWPVVLLGIWIAGVGIALLRLVTGILWAGWITRRGTPVTDPQWLSILEDTRAALGVGARVSLRYSTRTTIPVACGLVRPAVLLPVDADDWSDERRRVVLTHEMAHVRRRDCLVQAVAQLVRALQWFNPMAHVAIARLRVEQERACDDLVLASGTKAPIYADHLFEIAQAFRSAASPLWATVAMARPSQLEGRVLAILDARRNRRPLARGVRAVIGLAAVAMILPVGALELTAAAELPVMQVPVTQEAPVPPPPPPPAVAPPAPPKSSAQLSIEINAEAVRSAARQARRNRDVPDTHALDEAVDVLVNQAMNTVIDSLPNFDFDFDINFDQGPNPRLGLGQVPGGNALPEETHRRVADALIAALNDESADVREQALASLSTMRDPRAIPGLLKMLRDPMADLRQRAVDALAQFNTQEAVDGIVSAMKDASPEVREHAARALGRVARTKGRAVPPVPPAAPGKPGVPLVPPPPGR